MTNSYDRYKSQHKKANEALDILKATKAEIDLSLAKDTISATLHKELRTVNLEIKITLNEIEQAESDMKRCELQLQMQ